MRSIDENEATDFNELLCPECGEYSIEKHSAIAEEYSSYENQLVYASRCTNPDCPKNKLNPDEVRIQLKEEPLKERIISTLTNPLIIGLISLLILGLVAVTLFQMGVFSPPPTASVTGTVVGPNNEPVDGAVIYIDTKKGTTNKTGKYTIENVPVGEHTVYIIPPSSSSLSATSNETLRVKETTLEVVASKSTKIQNNSVKTTLSPTVTRTVTGVTSNETIPLNYTTPHNAQNYPITIKFSPLPSDKTTHEKTVQSGESIVINTPHKLPDSEVTVTAEKGPIQTTLTRTYTGKTTYFISEKGIQRGRLILGNKETDIHNKTKKIRSEGQIPFNLNSSGSAPVSVLVTPMNTNESAQQISGTYTGTNPDLTLEQSSSEVQLTVVGEISQTKEREHGEISNTVPINFKGNLPIENGKITLKEKDTAAFDSRITSNASSGTRYKKQKVKTIRKNGTYTLHLNFSGISHNELVSAGYQIGEKTKTVNAGTTTVDITINDQPKTIYAWVKAKNSITQNKTQPDNKNRSEKVRLVGYTADKTKISPGESTTVTVTLENTDTKIQSKKIILHKNGNPILQRIVYLDPKETKQEEISSVSFNKTGTLTINNLNKTVIQVTGTQSEYGVGTLTTKIQDKTPKEVEIDTDEDGVTDCTITLPGTCSLPEFSPGTHDITLTKEASNVTYDLTYTQRKGQSDISIDIDNDGAAELEHEGVLEDGEKLTKTVTLPAGDHSPDFTIGNDGELKYYFNWGDTKPGIQNLQIHIDGKQVISKDELLYQESFILEDVSPGTHTLNLRADNSVYTATTQWSTAQIQPSPTIKIDGKTVCTTPQFKQFPLGVCNLPLETLSNSQHTIEMSDMQNKNYTISYAKSGTPSKVKISINNKTRSIQPTTQGQENQWTRSIPISLQKGENIVSLQTVPAGGKATATLQYTIKAQKAKEPYIKLPNKNKIYTENTDEDGYLISTTTKQVSIPLNTLHKGKNKIQIGTENNAPIRYNLTYITQTK